MRKTIFLLLVIAGFGLSGCSAFERGKDAATTPYPTGTTSITGTVLDGKTPLKILVETAPALGAAVATGNIPQAVSKGADLIEQICIILAAAAGLGGAGAITARNIPKKPAVPAPTNP